MIIKRRKVKNNYEIWLCDIEVADDNSKKIIYLEKLGNEEDLVNADPESINKLKKKYENNSETRVVTSFKANDIPSEKKVNVKTTKNTEALNNNKITITFDKSINPRMMNLLKSSKQNLFENVRKLKTSSMNFKDIFNIGYKFIEDLYNKLQIDKIILDEHNKEINENLKFMLYIRILFPDSFSRKLQPSICFFNLPNYNFDTSYTTLTKIKYNIPKLRTYMTNQYKKIYKKNYQNSFFYKNHYFENIDFHNYLDLLAGFLVDTLKYEINQYAPSKRSELSEDVIINNIMWTCVTILDNNLYTFVNLEPELILISHILNRPIINKFITKEELLNLYSEEII